MERSERVLGCVFIPVHVFILPVILGVILSLFAPLATPPELMLIYYTISFLLILAIMFKFLRASFNDLIDGFWRAVLFVALGYALYRVFLFVLALLLTQVMSTDNPNTEAIDAAVNADFRTMLVVSVVLAPIVEESIFRGALFGSVRQRSRFLAYIVSIIVFAAYHLWEFLLFDFSIEMLLFGLQYVPASIALAWCYERGGTIWSPILLHAAINLTAVLQS